MSCLGDCWDLGPPPDSILFLPPPPAPYFVQSPLGDLLNSTPCSATQLCESFTASNRIPDAGGDYIDLPRKEVETWSVSSIDDTWLLVLVASSIGVLLLGALLAMFLLKCREMNMFGSNECSLHAREHLRPTKHHEPRECAAVPSLNSNKLVHPSEAVLYHGSAAVPDNRMVWAALTPRGTQHFVSENYPRDLVDFVESDDHYETIESVQSALPPHTQSHAQYQQNQHQYHPHTYHHSYEPYCKDYDYEEPAPLIESYRLAELEGAGFVGNTDMRCASLGLGSLRRGVPLGVALRPRVSQPTRIEHPNLPPLNLYPHSTLSRKGALNYRMPDTTATLPKYGC